MSPKNAARLTALFPAKWRARYGAEFQTLLADERITFVCIGNVVMSALNQHVRVLGKAIMSHRQDSFILTLYAGAAAFAAGLNFYWTIDDTPLGPAMREHALWQWTWWAVALGALGTFGAGLVAAMPGLFAVIKAAFKEKRSDLFASVGILPGALAILVGWLVVATLWSGAHWVPTPWDITGDWPVPETWPPMSQRWVMGCITLGLLLLALIGGPLGLRYATRRARLTPGFSMPRPALWCLCATIGLMTIGAVGWVVSAHAYMPGAINTHIGGFLNSTVFASCVGSALLLVVALTAASSALRTDLAE